MKYIFLHIPKTAGSSFRTDILNNNLNNNYFGYADLEILVNNNFHLDGISEGVKDDNFFDKYDSFSSHMVYGLHVHLPTKNEYTYLVILRHPVERIISHYRFDAQRNMVPGSISVIDWLKDGRMGHTNILTNVMCGVNHYDVEKNYIWKNKIAIDNLKKDNVIFGYSENYDEYLNIINKKLGWKGLNKVTNKTNAPYNVKESDKKKLFKLCSNDINFYDESLKIYNEKYSNIIND